MLRMYSVTLLHVLSNNYYKLTHCLRSTGAPQPDGTLNKATRMKNNHYRQNYAELPEPVVFIPVAASTSGRINGTLDTRV